MERTTGCHDEHALAVIAGTLGVALGYLVAAALLPDVAATLRGLYGAQVSPPQGRPPDLHGAYQGGALIPVQPAAGHLEGRAIQGHIAGKMTKSNIIGYIASYPIPEVIRGINAAYIHAAKVNPDVELKIIWAYTWFAPAKEADAARALIEQGADVVLQHTDSTAPQAAAQEAGNVVTFGQASDMGQYAPFPRVSSIIDDWAPYYIARTKAVMDGSWESKDTWDGIGAGMVGIGEITDAVPADVKEEALAMKAAIADGSYHPFTGPLKKQDGSDWLADGEVADDGTLAGLNFYVEGLTGEIPQ